VNFSTFRPSSRSIQLFEALYRYASPAQESRSGRFWTEGR
jgi:hypothetical protein